MARGQQDAIFRVPAKVDALTRLRFFAAATIVLHHSRNGVFISFDSLHYFVLDRAVHMFFALSGFVLVLNANKYKSFMDFVVARVARIWPAHVVALLFAVAVLSDLRTLLDPTQVWRLATVLSLQQAWFPDLTVVFAYNGPSWSISVELFFYLMFFPIFLFLKPSLFTRAAFLAVFFVLFLYVCDWIARAAGITEHNWLYYINPLANLPIFVMGIVTGMISQRLIVHSANYWLSSAIQIACLLLAVFVDHIEPKQGTIVFGFFEFGRVDGATKAAATYCLLFLALRHFDGVISRALSFRPIVYLGEISYSIYLLHLAILLWAASHSNIFGLPPWGTYVLAILVMLALSMLCYEAVETRARVGIVSTCRKISAWLQHRREPSVVGQLKGASPQLDRGLSSTCRAKPSAINSATYQA